MNRGLGAHGIGSPIQEARKLLALEALEKSHEEYRSKCHHQKLQIEELELSLQYCKSGFLKAAQKVTELEESRVPLQLRLSIMRRAGDKELEESYKRQEKELADIKAKCMETDQSLLKIDDDMEEIQRDVGSIKETMVVVQSRLETERKIQRSKECELSTLLNTASSEKQSAEEEVVCLRTKLSHAEIQLSTTVAELKAWKDGKFQKNDIKWLQVLLEREKTKQHELKKKLEKEKLNSMTLYKQVLKLKADNRQRYMLPNQPHSSSEEEVALRRSSRQSANDHSNMMSSDSGYCMASPP